jgi:hypothetical protein
MGRKQQREIVDARRQHKGLRSTALQRRGVVKPNTRRELQQQRRAARVAAADPALQVVLALQEAQGEGDVADVLRVRGAARGVRGAAGVRGVRGVRRERVVEGCDAGNVREGWRVWGREQVFQGRLNACRRLRGVAPGAAVDVAGPCWRGRGE